MPSSAPCETRASYTATIEQAGHSARTSWLIQIAMVAAFVLWTLAILPAGLVTACTLWLLDTLLPPATGPRRNRPALQKWARLFITFYGRVTLWLIRPFVPVRLCGREHWLPKLCGPGIITPNHQSFLDLYLLGAQAQADLCLVSKHWPYRLLFFFAPLMRLAGYVDVERLNPEEVEAVCLERLRAGATLVIFPEGRRTRDGQLGRFHVGAFVLACKAQVPVIPLVIHNSGQVFPVGAARFSPATIRMDMLAPVQPGPFGNDMLPHRAMQRHVRALMARQLQPVPGDCPQGTCEEAICGQS